MTVLKALLAELLEALQRKEFGRIKQVSSDAARDAFVYEDDELVETSLIAYSLYKLGQKPYIARSGAWKEFEEEVLERLEACTNGADAGRTVHRLMEDNHKLSLKFGRFAQSTVEKGRLKAAAQMYAHGASLSKAVELSGAPISLAAAYIGSTKIAEKYQTQAVPVRLKIARSLFG